MSYIWRMSSAGRALTTILVSIRISKPRIGNTRDNEDRLNSAPPSGPIVSVLWEMKLSSGVPTVNSEV